MPKTIVIDNNDRLFDHNGQLVMDLSKYDADRELIYRLRTALDEANRNKYQKFLDVGEAIDGFRVIPRLFMGLYGYLTYEVILWFQALQEPTLAQAGLVTTVTGVLAPLFSFYVSSGKKKKSVTEGE